jgi:hypothetical protein
LGSILAGIFFGIACVVGLWIFYPNERTNWREMTSLFLGSVVLFPAVEFSVVFLLLTLVNAITGYPLLDITHLIKR